MKLLDRSESPRFASLFLPLDDIAELSSRAAFGVVGTQAALHEIVGALCDVEPQVGVHLTLHRPRMDHRTEKRSDARPERHKSSDAAVSTNPMASESRPQYAISSVSRRRPAAVSR